MPSSQLTFAKENGIKVTRGNPRENTPGKSIVIPERVDQLRVEDFSMDKIRHSYIKNAIKAAGDYELTEADERFLAEDSKSSLDQVREVIQSSNH